MIRTATRYRVTVNGELLKGNNATMPIGLAACRHI